MSGPYSESDARFQTRSFTIDVELRDITEAINVINDLAAHKEVGWATAKLERPQDTGRAHAIVEKLKDYQTKAEYRLGMVDL